jgi:hypothetical protein
MSDVPFLKRGMWCVRKNGQLRKFKEECDALEFLGILQPTLFDELEELEEDSEENNYGYRKAWKMDS